MGCFKTCELSLKFIFKVWSNVIWTHGDLAFFLCLKFCQNLTLPLGGGIIIAITNVLLVIRFDCCFFIRNYFNYMILSLCDSVTMSDFIHSSLDKFPIMLEAKVLHEPVCWDMPEIYLRYAWYLSDICLKLAFHMPEIYMRFAWNRPMICLWYCLIYWLRYVSNRPETYQR